MRCLKIKYNIIHKSIIGKKNRGKGRTNEDYKIVDKNKNIFIVADGMGGHNAPSDASYVASLMVYKDLKEVVNSIRKISTFQKDDVIYDMRGIISGVSGFIYDGAKGSEYLVGMGTTIDAALIHDDVVYFAHVGDGGLFYLEKGNEIKKISNEHIDFDGNLNSHIGHKSKNITIDTGYISFNKGDIFFMATDGLTKSVSESEIKKILEKDYSRASKELISRSSSPLEMAINYSVMNSLSYKTSKKYIGGRDNTTFIGIKGE